MTNLGPLHMCDVVMLGLLVVLIIVGVGVVSNALTILGGPVFYARLPWQDNSRGGA